MLLKVQAVAGEATTNNDLRKCMAMLCDSLDDVSGLISESLTCGEVNHRSSLFWGIVNGQAQDSGPFVRIGKR